MFAASTTVVTRLALVVAAVVAGGLAVASTVGGDSPPPDVGGHEPLRATAGADQRFVGVAVGHDAFLGDERFRSLVVHDFDTVTFENELKWSEVHVAPGEFDFARADAMLARAERDDLAVRGHTLVWHEQLPSWLDDARLGREQAIELLRVHISTVVSRYAGRVAHWDVVNEPLSHDGSGLRETVWSRTIGDEYLSLAFEFAHEADPTARLFLNDYDGSVEGEKYDSLIDLADRLRRDGVPVHGVGFQLHLDGRLDATTLAGLVQRASDLGLEVAFTEVDDRIPADAGPAELARQARRLGKVASICAAAPACSTFVVWGLTDGHSWVPTAFPGYGHATLFDADFAPKPAHSAVVSAFTDAADTQVEGG